MNSPPIILSVDDSNFFVKVGKELWPIRTVDIYTYYCVRCDETDKCSHTDAVARFVAEKMDEDCERRSWKE